MTSRDDDHKGADRGAQQATRSTRETDGGAEVRQIEVTLGPYAGHILTVPVGAADDAIGARWAIEPRTGPIDANAPAMPSLSPEEHQAAEQAAAEWAATIAGTKDAKAARADEDKRRDVHANDKRGGYETRAPRGK